MKLRYDSGHRTHYVTLSRRNLLSLLHKIDGMENSAGTLVSFNCFVDGEQDMSHTVWVKIEPDEVHYADREPGLMHPETEEFLKNHG